ncbi:GNAT family N-acetyltransferase [Mesotoga sp. UBA6090]|uniref:GNAT family N-acetyltransferase n=1 Tax=Mesotoga sp. UBA6090 TaxID=1946860 RepID=UPI0025D1B681|nr:GNAT family N-acetyltransferase [Mesotoga sp. UBA6090]
MQIAGYSKEYTEQMLRIQRVYEMEHPLAERFAFEDLKNPLLNGRKNIFLAVDNGRVVGFLRFLTRQNFSTAHFHHIWLDITVDEGADNNLMSLLYETALPSIVDTTSNFFPAAGTKICVRIADSESEKKDFFSNKGFAHWIDFEYMERDLKREISSHPFPSGLIISQMKPRKSPEILKYLLAEQSCFPDSPLEYKYLHYFFSRPEWKNEGLILASLDLKRNIAGSVMLYPDNTDNSKFHTEEIFVVERWRNKGLARALLAESLKYLKKKGKDRAFLSVTSDRTSAKRLYEEAGFRFLYKREVLTLKI